MRKLLTVLFAIIPTVVWAQANPWGTAVTTQAAPYTVASTDCGTTILISNGGTITLPNSISIGCPVRLIQGSSSAVTVAAVPLSARAQIGLNSFGLNLAFPTTTAPKVFSGACRLWDASGAQGSPGANDVSWLAVETANGAYSWTTLDAQIAKCKAAGQRIIYTFGDVPGWANGNTGAWEPPTSFSTLYAFMTSVVQRYAGDHIIYSTWNEANTPGIWWSGTQAQMLTIAAQLQTIVRANDNTALVANPTMTGWGGSMFPWVETYFSAGGGAFADVMDVHCYPYEGSAYGSTPATTTPEAIWNQLQQFQAILAFNGQGSKPLICDEGGWTTQARTGFTLEQETEYASKWLIFNASAGISPSAWYSYDDSVWGTLWDGSTWLNQVGVGFRATQAWLIGATITTPAARVALTNQVRNPTGTGMVPGTPGTPPTNWSVNNPDSGHGISTSFVGTCGAGGAGVEFLVSGTATAGATGYVQLSFEASNHIAATLNQFWTFTLSAALLSGATVPADSTFVMEMNESNSSGTYLDTVLYYIFAPFGGSLAQGTQAFGTNATNASVAFVVPVYSVTYSVGDTLNVPICLGAPSVDAGTIWTSNLNDPSGNAEQIVWDAGGGPTSYSTSYGFAADLKGHQTPLSGTATLTNSPVLLSNHARLGWTP